MEICIKVDELNTIDLLNKILQNQITIMALIDDLKSKVSDLQTQAANLQTSLDNEQAQVAALLESNATVVTDLNNQITTLKDQIANGATPEQLQEVINGISAIAENIATTKTDLEGTIEDTLPTP